MRKISDNQDKKDLFAGHHNGKNSETSTGQEGKSVEEMQKEIESLGQATNDSLDRTLATLKSTIVVAKETTLKVNDNTDRMEAVHQDLRSTQKRQKNIGYGLKNGFTWTGAVRSTFTAQPHKEANAEEEEAESQALPARLKKQNSGNSETMSAAAPSRGSKTVNQSKAPASSVMGKGFDDKLDTVDELLDNLLVQSKELNGAIKDQKVSADALEGKLEDVHITTKQQTAKVEKVTRKNKGCTVS